MKHVLELLDFEATTSRGEQLRGPSSARAPMAEQDSPAQQDQPRELQLVLDPEHL